MSRNVTTTTTRETDDNNSEKMKRALIFFAFDDRDTPDYTRNATDMRCGFGSENDGI
jgi:hypothetical protein